MPKVEKRHVPSILAFDAEVTGIDLRYAARPFYVSTCDDQGNTRFWEWPVNPLTREPIIPPEDIKQIQALLGPIGPPLVGQNVKFDVAALATVGVTVGNWHKINDTLMAGHLLNSAQPHDLTFMVRQYLRDGRGKSIDIKPLEDNLAECVKKARQVIQQARLRVSRGSEPKVTKSKKPGHDPTQDRILAKWMISQKDLEGMPSIKDETWRADYWLPRALAKYLNYPSDHPWWTVLQEYANADSEVTVRLWMVMEHLLKQKNLWEIYLERMKVVPIVTRMQEDGVTISKSRLTKLNKEYLTESVKLNEVCVGIAKGMDYDLELPKSGNNSSLTKFLFGEKVWGCSNCGNEVIKETDYCPKCLKKELEIEVNYEHRPWFNLPIVGRTEKGNPSLDKDAMEVYSKTLPDGESKEFIESLKGKRKCDTRVTYLKSYLRYGIPRGDDQLLLYPGLNPTGTSTLRFSSSNPNGQNIDKKGEECQVCEGNRKDDQGNICSACKGLGLKFRSLKYVFGPAPGREWWSMDYENIELRIPGYESKEKVMIELFEKPDEAPYFGSYHLMNASIIYPEQFWPLADKKGEFKKKYASTYYQWTKNFGFAFAYGAQDATADKAAHKPGARKMISEKLKEHSRLNKKYVDMANRLGYVETIPDKSIGAKRGYPIYCSRNNYERISPTVPLNFHVQSSAMWCTMKAMIRCQAQLDDWSRQEGKMYRIALQVHDEIVVDFPKGGVKNLPKIRKIKQLMEMSGNDISIPLRVSVNYHVDNWSEECSWKS